MKNNRKEILRLLAETYPEARPELNFSNPYETLVAVMLFVMVLMLSIS